MASQRHIQRIAVMQCIFEYEFRGSLQAPDEVLLYNLEQFGDKLDDVSFSKGLLAGVLAHRTEIERIICEKAPEWPLDKISPIDRAILEVAVFEMLFSADVPPVVAIDEAIEIAKVYGSDNSSKFVNGVLSSVLKAYPQEAIKTDKIKTA